MMRFPLCLLFARSSCCSSFPWGMTKSSHTFYRVGNDANDVDDADDVDEMGNDADDADEMGNDADDANEIGTDGERGST